MQKLRKLFCVCQTMSIWTFHLIFLRRDTKNVKKKLYFPWIPNSNDSILLYRQHFVYSYFLWFCNCSVHRSNNPYSLSRRSLLLWFYLRARISMFNVSRVYKVKPKECFVCAVWQIMRVHKCTRCLISSYSML